MAKRADSQRRSQAMVSDWRQEAGSIPEPWQRMHLVLDLLSVECSNGAGARPERVQDLADFGISIFPAEIEHHLPNGILGFSQDVSRPQFEAARRVMTTLGWVRRWSVHRHGDPSVHLADIEQCLAWIESTLRPIYNDTWKTTIDCVENERLAASKRVNRPQAPERSPSPHADREMVDRAIDSSLRLALHCERVVKAWNSWKRRQRLLPTRGKRPDGLFQYLSQNIESAEQLDEHFQARRRGKLGKLKNHWLGAAESLESLQLEIRLWRAHLDALRARLPELGPWMDDQREPPASRWTANTQTLLRQLGGFCNRRTWVDIPGDFDVAAFRAKASDLDEVIRGLRAVEGLPPSSSPTEKRDVPRGIQEPAEKTPHLRASSLPADSPKGAPINPTPPMSLALAARLKSIDPRTLKDSMINGNVRFMRSSNKLWVFCGSEFHGDAQTKLVALMATKQPRLNPPPKKQHA